MVVKLRNVSVMGAQIGISVSKGTDVDFDGGFIQAIKCGIEERDEPSLMSMIGLPADTPPDALLLALMILRGRNNADRDESERILKTSKIGAYLRNCTDLSTVVSNLTNLANSPQGQQLIIWLQSLAG